MPKKKRAGPRAGQSKLPTKLTRAQIKARTVPSVVAPDGSITLTRVEDLLAQLAELTPPERHLFLARLQEKYGPWFEFRASGNAKRNGRPQEKKDRTAFIMAKFAGGLTPGQIAKLFDPKLERNTVSKIIDRQQAREERRKVEVLAMLRAIGIAPKTLKYLESRRPRHNLLSRTEPFVRIPMYAPPK